VQVASFEGVFMRSHWVIGVLAASIGVATFWPAQADACTCSPDAFGRMNPEPGATDVARNHAVVVAGFFDPETLELTTADGTAVPFELEAGPSSGCGGTMYAELIPKDGYAANTTYRVRAVPTYPESAVHDFTFTTGDWYWPEPEAYPALEAKISMLTSYPPSGVGCSVGSIMSCITLNYWKDVEVIARKDGEIMMRWVLLANDPNFLFKVVPDCLEFSRREPSGARTTPLEVCGDALNVSPFVESEVGHRNFFCQGGLVGVGAHARPISPPPDHDAGVDVDVITTNEAGSGGAADAKSTSAPREDSASDPNDANDANQRDQPQGGCVAVRTGRAPSASASGLLLLVGFVLAARRRANAEKSAPPK
jgi:hypothetical protein